MSVDTWYHTLSTISQVLAATIGLYAIFIIFKIEKINEFIEELRSIAINIIASVETHQNINSNPKKPMIDEQTLIIHSNRELMREAKEAIDTAHKIGMSMSYSAEKTSYRNMENIPLTFEREVLKKERVIKSLKFNFILSFITILISIILLIFSDYIYCSGMWLLGLSILIPMTFLSLILLTSSTFKISSE